MKCNHCKAEWTVPGSQPTTCPFCGKPLTTGTETNNTPKIPEQILKRMFDDFGADVFRSKTRLSGMLADFLSHDKKTLRLLKFATEYNIPAQLLNAQNSDAADQKIRILTLKQNFKEEYLLEESSAFYAVDCFAFALLGIPLQLTTNEAESRSENLEKETLIRFRRNNQWGYKDINTGKVIIPLKYDVAAHFSEGLATVELNKKCGFIDKTGKEVVPLKYDVASHFSEGLARVKLNRKWGFIDKTGKEVIPLKYDFAIGFSEGLAEVILNGKRGFIDKTGKEVVPSKYDVASDFSEGQASVKLGNEEFCIDKSGKRID
jgi:hypothetical protein